MPHLRIETNVSKDKIPGDFLTKTVELLAKLLKKPLSYCVVSIHPDIMMTWGGTNDPCGIARILSIGGLGGEIDTTIAEILHNHFKHYLGIQDNRLYIHYIDETSQNISYGGKSFKQIFGL